jgi:uncharacterized protein (DUF2252 family)
MDDVVGAVASRSFGDRRASGKALRRSVPRSSHGRPQGVPPDRDPIEILERQAETRAADLVPIRYARMSESPFAFFRGGAAIMAMDLATTPTTGLIVQACGDAHVNNFGKFATPERNVMFDVNDFDETLPGPWEWDVKRLCTSLFIVARERGFSRSRSRRIAELASRTYRERMAAATTMSMLDLWYDHIDVDHMAEHLPASYRTQLDKDLTKAHRKDHVRAVSRLTTTVDGEVRFADDPPLVVHMSDLGVGIDDVASTIEGYRTSISDERLALFDRFRVVDVARKVVGVGSVGTWCWIALLEGPDRPGGDRIVLQIKEAQPSVLEPYTGAPPAEHNGRRVVVGQRLTQAASDLLLGWSKGARSGHHYYVRQLWDVKGQSDVTRMRAVELGYYGELCAWALARGHARTGDPVELAGYLGRSDAFDRAMGEFAVAYAATNAQDHAALMDSIASGRVVAAAG